MTVPTTDPESTVRVTSDAGVARVVLARPDKRNAFDPTMIAELGAAFRSLAAAPDVRVVVLSGDGPVFSAGADVDYMRALGAASYADNVADARLLAALFAAIRDCPRPVVARVHGAAVGGGAGLVAAADIAVAARSTRFAFGESRLGVVPAVISPFVVPRIGPAAARELFLTGETFDAERAAAIGLVARVVDDDRLDEAVAERVDALLAAAPGAHAAIKRLIAVVAGATKGDDVLEFTTDLIARCRASDEGCEGLSAFLERRKPTWSRRPAPSAPSESSARAAAAGGQA